MLIKALSLRQPWAYAVLNLGKRVENRDWQQTNRARKFRGTFLIHVSKSRTRMDREDYEELTWRGGHIPGFISRQKLLAMPNFEDLERGGIVGITDVVGSIENANCMEHVSTQHDWYNGGFALKLANVKPLPLTPCNGMLGFFSIETLNLPGLEQAIANVRGNKKTPAASYSHC